MGDAADEALERYFLGSDDADYPDYGFSYGPPPTVTCRHCRKRGLVWRQQPGGWRLYSEAKGQLHNCRTAGQGHRRVRRVGVLMWTPGENVVDLGLLRHIADVGGTETVNGRFPAGMHALMGKGYVAVYGVGAAGYVCWRITERGWKALRA